MWKALLGFVAGVALTSALFLARAPESTANASATSATPSVPALNQTTPSIASAPATPEPTKSSGAAPTKPAVPVSFDPASIAASPADIAAAATGEQPRDRRATPARRDAKSELSEGSAAIVAKDRLHPDSVSQLYEDFSGQRTDSGWAAATQQAMSNYFGRTAPPRGFDITGLSCHESLCEIQAKTYPGSDRGVAWTDLMHGLYRQTPPLNIGAERWKLDDQSGTIYILTFVARAR